MIRRVAFPTFLGAAVVAAPSASGSSAVSLPIRIGHGSGPVDVRTAPVLGCAT